MHQVALSQPSTHLLFELISCAAYPVAIFANVVDESVSKGLNVDFIIALSACVYLLSFSIYPCHSCLFMVSLDCAVLCGVALHTLTILMWSSIKPAAP